MINDKIQKEYRKKHNLPVIEDYGFSKKHHPKSQEIYNYISELDFANGDAFCFKNGGDGDNGELLMDLLDKYFEKELEKATEILTIPNDEQKIKAGNIYDTKIKQDMPILIEEIRNIFINSTQPDTYYICRDLETEALEKFLETKNIKVSVELIQKINQELQKEIPKLPFLYAGADAQFEYQLGRPSIICQSKPSDHIKHENNDLEENSITELVDISSEKFWDILFDEACVEGNQAERIKNELNKISISGQEIQNKTIDELENKIYLKTFTLYDPDKADFINMVEEITEQMKAKNLKINNNKDDLEEIDF